MDMASITSYAAVGISFFQNKTLLEYQTKNFNDEFIVLRLEETVDTVNNVPIQIYSSSTIDDFDHSIKSSLATVLYQSFTSSNTLTGVALGSPKACLRAD